MKRMFTMLLCLALATCLLVLPVGAEEYKGESDMVEDPVLTIGEEDISTLDPDANDVVGEIPVEEEMEEMDTFYEDIPQDVEMQEMDTFAEDAPGDVQMQEMETFRDESTGFLGWLKNLWASILKFFGL